MISPLPGVTATKPGSAQVAVPGIAVDVVDDDRRSPCPTAGGGYLVLTKPWPAMLRGIWGDPERYKETYWSRFAERATSPATAPRRTTTATSGCSAASTTS